eukprot:TRINITY_DN6164_c0_g1_i1.p1 TRINITY_DN6164_c0_g1~~TRINITY_DN6164_c0_g1_i1.p1  ORF type:complete len:613 (+),score=152.74 TRINITY_DN6164_c0_g1_i1:55-1839(+)
MAATHVGGVPVKLLVFPVLALLTILWVFYVPTAMEGFHEHNTDPHRTALEDDEEAKPKHERVAKLLEKIENAKEARGDPVPTKAGGDHSDHDHDHGAPTDVFPECYRYTGRYEGDAKYGGLLHRVFEDWNGKPLFRRRDGKVWMGIQSTGLWVVAQSREELLVHYKPHFNAAGLVDRPEEVMSWVETGTKQKFPQMSLAEETPTECRKEFPDCILSTGPVENDFKNSGFYRDTLETLNGAPVYHRPFGSWWRVEGYVARLATGHWAFATSVDNIKTGTYEYVSTNPAARPDEAGGYTTPPGSQAAIPGFEVQSAWGDCTDGIPLDTAVPWGEPGDVDPVNGTHYIADYGLHEMKDDPAAYAYPMIDRAYTFISDRRPTLPHVAIALQPRLLFFPNFLTEADCDAIVSIAHSRLSRSQVSLKHGKDEEGSTDDVRTSWQTWLDLRHEPVRRLIRRILAVTGFQHGDAESLQILRYQQNQKYEAHEDYFDPAVYGWQNNNRALTCFIYLNTVEKGGWTWFPKANGETMDGKTYSSCNGGMRTVPKKGSVACFYDMRPDRSLDPHSLHAGCPVLAGEKWGGTLWLHAETPDKDSKGG